MAIKYADGKLEREFKMLPEAIQRVVKELAEFVRDQAAEDALDKDVTVTCVLRDPAQNTKVGGVATSLHLDCRAVDLRSKNYGTKQMDQISAWLSRRCPRKAYEVITKPHGTGPHIHIGLRRAFNA